MSRRRRKASEEIEREEIPIGIGSLWAGVEAIDNCGHSRLTVHPGIGLKREKGESQKRRGVVEEKDEDETRRR